MRRVLSIELLSLSLALAVGTSSAWAQSIDTPTTEAPAATVAPTPAPAADPSPELRILPGVEIFTGYRLTFTNTDGHTDWFHAFVLDRAAASLGVHYGDASARLIFEAVSSAAPGSLLGVSGESFVARFREAWIGYTLWDALAFRAGMVPELTQPALERVERLRPVSRTAVDEFGLHPQSDVGATATYALPADYGALGVGLYNGEGFDRRELNRGKNVELSANVHPLAGVPALAPASLLVGYVNGSQGTSSARADRLTGALLWNQPWLSGGGSFTYAMGLENDGARRAWLVQGFARAQLDWFIFGLRAAYFARNTATSDDNLLTLLATVGTELLQGVETYVTVDRRIPGAITRYALPGSDEWRISVTARLTLGE